MLQFIMAPNRSLAEWCGADQDSDNSEEPKGAEWCAALTDAV